ncbi:MAG TPA: hypothetical protein VJ698_19335 [Noviherbaspirillum sp.]|uniref:hypothetical protein n=1 Tax=Noviherbaspirillum sp. TaxID=1926288 RepID=UPI002B4921F0|nr:hypothetical protein [Noviherbaspirillum sp.]HJV87631.1 hypothetical protein [Noviherbaspirillum sp.]
MMKNVCRLLLPTVMLFTLPLVALADSWKDEGGNGHKHKEKYWDGNCKVERKFKKNGEFEEKRKCKDPGEPAVIYAPGPPVMVEPGLTIQGTVRIPQ